MMDSEGRTTPPPDRIRASEEHEALRQFDSGSAQIESPRHPQQDYCKVSPPFEGQTYLVAMVADGVSSTASAAEASRSAVEWFVRELQKRVEKEEIDKEVVENTIRLVNIFLLSEADRKSRDIEDDMREKGAHLDSYNLAYNSDMFTTFVGIVIIGDKVISVYLGDSRLYLYSGGQLARMTEDETKAEELKSRGVTKITKKDESILTNCLGADDAEQVLDEYEVGRGDTWLLVSDGVYHVLSDEELKQILSQSKDAQSLANDIIEAVKAKGVVDDTTAVVVKVK
ncbi:MAG: hypothetical protein A3G00_01390 [Candidatus Magasanikbacteria bacterium RIFCSPLOWO2_12_FULL_43_12]|uniref:PPM-type phosphatase domain-containing protein n=1 Tax=Candidatus Magasanikbacteria bacterium RIFCSPLOWO2_12_FULL_43_12 TaxID=1798692 RepID=A0A1F6MTM1_9BACT|nr:MAG: hypothetical protein A3G00_01390 [Candidatus Magasanikbacteria bacterium RIFCSPLOWO2_12_FULL_43_12]